MKQKSLARWLKVITVFITLIMMMCLYWIFPVGVKELCCEAPECQNYVPLGLSVVLAASIPCWVSLICFWRVATRIGRDDSFCMFNARMLRIIGFMAVTDTLLCFFTVICMIFMGGVFPLIILVAFAIIVFGATIAIVAFALSHLVEKAARMKDENDLTV